MGASLKERHLAHLLGSQGQFSGRGDVAEFLRMNRIQPGWMWVKGKEKGQQTSRRKPCSYSRSMEPITCHKLEVRSGVSAPDP